jgi:hypothetical protein
MVTLSTKQSDHETARKGYGMTLEDDERYKLLHQWASHFGYYDGKIDLSVGGNLEAFATYDAVLEAHAPLWGTKPGQEVAIPAKQVRASLARMLRWFTPQRHDMHIALHPDELSLCLFFVVKARLKLLPITVQTVPLVYLVSYAETDKGLRIRRVDEWPARTPKEAERLIKDKLGWPESVTLEPARVFGAVS